MTTEGFYAIEYAGVAGTGMGELVLDTGLVIGSDFVGGKYDGRYTYNPRLDAYDVELTVTVPPGAWLVQGVPARSDEYTFEIRTTLPRDFAGQKFVQVATPFGPVNVAFRKLRDFPD